MRRGWKVLQSILTLVYIPFPAKKYLDFPPNVPANFLVLLIWGVGMMALALPWNILKATTVFDGLLEFQPKSQSSRWKRCGEPKS